MKNETLSNEVTDLKQTTQNTNNTTDNNSSAKVKDRYLHIDNDVPACGIAFRRWLCNA